MLSRLQHQLRALAIALVGLLAMLWNLGTPSLWQDEAATIGAANRPLNSLWRLVGNIDAVHGFYYALMHFWGDAFGFTPFSLRVPSALAVAASAYLLYFLALKVSNKNRVAIWAAIVFLALPRTHMSGGEARSNALTATLAIALTLLFSQVLEEPKRIRRWIAFILVAALSIYVFMFSALIFTAFGMYLALKNRDLLLRFTASTIAALALAAPVLIYGFREKGQVGWITTKSIWAYLWESLVAVDFNRAWPMAILGLLLAVFAVLNRASLLVLLWAMLPSALLIAISLIGQPYFVDHYLTFTTPATAILIAMGLNSLSWPSGNDRKTRLLQAAIGVCLVALCIPSFISSREPTAKGTEWAQIAQAIKQNSSAGDSVLLPDASTKTARALDLMIVAYAPEFAGRIDLTLKTKPEDSRLLFGKRMPEASAIEPLTGRVLLVTDTQGGVASGEPEWLQRDFRASKVLDFASAKISVFVRSK